MENKYFGKGLGFSKEKADLVGFNELNDLIIIVQKKQ